jgi:hypothetical protein
LSFHFLNLAGINEKGARQVNLIQNNSTVPFWFRKNIFVQNEQCNRAHDTMTPLYGAGREHGFKASSDASYAGFLV